MSQRKLVRAGIFIVGFAGFSYLAFNSMKAAKRNAVMTRHGDGGQVSWGKEAERRHGQLAEPVQDKSIAGALFNEAVRRPPVEYEDQKELKQIQRRRRLPRPKPEQESNE